MSDAHGQIAALEDRVRELSERAEQCRKIDLAAKAILVGGFLVLVLPFFGLLRIGSAAWLIAIAAALGGTVLYGSNRSTLRSLIDQIGEIEARRTELIDRISPRLVEGGPTPRRLS